MADGSPIILSDMPSMPWAEDEADAPLWAEACPAESPPQPVSRTVKVVARRAPRANRTVRRAG
ncbi:hypothetical protein GCM10018782_64240 [Streptomyces griseoaurantiacus]|nr:hypothetical protein GCM10018782_64240 [Streptomyces griseoaurantiacus]